MVPVLAALAARHLVGGAQYGPKVAAAGRCNRLPPAQDLGQAVTAKDLRMSLEQQLDRPDHYQTKSLNASSTPFTQAPEIAG